MTQKEKEEFSGAKDESLLRKLGLNPDSLRSMSPDELDAWISSYQSAKPCKGGRTLAQPTISSSHQVSAFDPILSSISLTFLPAALLDTAVPIGAALTHRTNWPAER